MHLFIPFALSFIPNYTQLYPFIPQQKTHNISPQRISPIPTSGFLPLPVKILKLYLSPAAAYTAKEGTAGSIQNK